MDSAPIRDIDAATAKAWLDSGDTVMVDVREPHEVAQEAVPGARAAPMSSFDPAALDLGAARRIVMLCASGIRSARMGARLAAAGRGEVVNLRGGIKAWKAAGLPVETGAAAAAPALHAAAAMRTAPLAGAAVAALGLVLAALASPWFLILAAAGAALAAIALLRR